MSVCRGWGSVCLCTCVGTHRGQRHQIPWSHNWLKVVWRGYWEPNRYFAKTVQGSHHLSPSSLCLVFSVPFSLIFSAPFTQSLHFPFVSHIVYEMKEWAGECAQRPWAPPGLCSVAQHSELSIIGLFCGRSAVSTFGSAGHVFSMRCGLPLYSEYNYRKQANKGVCLFSDSLYLQ